MGGVCEFFNKLTKTQNLILGVVCVCVVGERGLVNLFDKDAKCKTNIFGGRE